jgi:hypothetical protein
MLLYPLNISFRGPCRAREKDEKNLIYNIEYRLLYGWFSDKKIKEIREREN